MGSLNLRAGTNRYPERYVGGSSGNTRCLISYLGAREFKLPQSSDKFCEPIPLTPSSLLCISNELCLSQNQTRPRLNWRGGVLVLAEKQDPLAVVSQNSRTVLGRPVYHCGEPC